MCGIAGWLGNVPDPQVYGRRVARALHHRGPDSSGLQSWPDVTLVHTRLSILDLTPAGAQPMSNEDGTVWTVFNGEIYNHHELRSSLEERGHVFRGRSDTEVLPHLYEEYGREFVARLRGMFALAIYDVRARTVLLARDPFGIKPLFYTYDADRVAFASELRPLLLLPGIDTRPNRQAVYDFAALFYIPAPDTFYSGVKALEPGTILQATLTAGRASCVTRGYHQWVIAPDDGLTLPQAARRTEELLGSAVQRQIESDVPMGALLSGGVDSSLVCDTAQTALGGTLRTFNVRFGDAAYDETWAAKAVAAHIGSEHLTLNMQRQEGSWESVAGLLQHAGQPFADTSIFAVHAIARAMRQHVTVALSGDGGDEGFGGYDFYWQLEYIARLQAVPSSFWRGAWAMANSLADIGMFRNRVPPHILTCAGADDPGIVQNLLCWIREPEQRLLCVDQHLLPVRRLFERQWVHHLSSGASRTERITALATEVNLRLILANDFLFKVDIASMREGLEIRVPMLDEDLFAFALTVPQRLKARGRSGKRILRALARRRLPSSVARKPKWGFAIPLDQWVDTSFRQNVRDVLLGGASRLPEFFRPEVYRPVIEAFCAGRPCAGVSRENMYRRVIMFLSLELALGATHMHEPVAI